MDGIITRERLAEVKPCSLKNVDKYLTKLRKKAIIGTNNEVLPNHRGTHGGFGSRQSESPKEQPSTKAQG